MPVVPKDVEPNYMAFHGGHDAAFVVYSAQRDKVYVFELEKLIGIKHANWPTNFLQRKTHQIIKGDPELLIQLFREELMRTGLKPEFRHVILGSTWGDVSKFSSEMLSADLLLKHFQVDNYSINQGHHLGHAWSGIAQMPPRKAVVITTDGGGDDAYFTISILDRDKKSFQRLCNSQHEEHKIGGIFESAGVHYLDSIVQSTPVAQDIVGKMMGAAAFGKPVDLGPEKRWYSLPKIKKPNQAMFNAFTYYGENNRFKFINKNHLTFQQECDICHTLQIQLEELFDKAIDDCIGLNVFEDLLRKHDNQIIMSGGVSLNIINNKRLQEKWGCKIWVPCNPGDVGLAMGYLFKWMYENNRLKLNSDTRYDNAYLGTRLKDADQLRDHRKLYGQQCYQVSVEEMAGFLKKGEIIAWMHGRQESGARALGHRSILCDASFPGMKDKVNTIKRREPYRPFAPICLWKDAHKWFEVDEVNNYKHMNIAVTVKEEYREQLASITHADNTARLQAFEPEDCGNVAALLETHGGVLLNTSFNLSGKPICNTLYEALHVLERTPLDKLIVEDDETRTFWCFEKYIE